MLFVCYTPKFPENPEPNRTNRDLGRSCSVSSRSIGCSSRFGLGLGREVKNLIGIGLNPRTDTEHRAVSVHSQACFQKKEEIGFAPILPSLTCASAQTGRTGRNILLFTIRASLGPKGRIN